MEGREIHSCVNWEAERLKPNKMKRRQQKRVDYFQYIPLRRRKVITYNNYVRTFFLHLPPAYFTFLFFWATRAPSGVE
jgi:hypothetical protein